MIAGDSGAQAPQSLRVTSWDCGKHGGAPPTSTVPTCPDARSKSLRLHVRFPDCWDGRRLDSADHRRHMAYSSSGVCLASHPVATPSIELIVQYPVAGGPGVELSSRGPFSGHADFVNAWQQAELKRLVDYCLNALRVCVEKS